MDDVIAVVNAGSSSLKFSLFIEKKQGLELWLHGQVGGLYTHPRFEVFKKGNLTDSKTWPESEHFGHKEAIEFLFDWAAHGPLHTRHRAVAVGHRVVHGGMDFTEPVKVDEEVMGKLEKLIPLAPLHQPYNLAAIQAISEHRPDLLQAACFDTSFHRTMPAIAGEFALPREYSEKGVKRYGFHGLSYEYISTVLPRFDAGAARGRTIVAHLGNGASMCAMQGCKSIASTMGFSAVEGLPMGTRCGSIDPGVLIYLMDNHGLDARALDQLIYKKSGLLGVSGISSDMHELLSSPDPRASEAVDLFVYRIVREMGSMAAALGGLDAIVFTGGIGEHAAEIRSRVCNDSGWLGIVLDEEANNKGGSRISRTGSPVSAWVIPTDEELMIARHTFSLMDPLKTSLT